jgi:hypothetical protein
VSHLYWQRGRGAQRRFAQSGDIAVWPFVRRSDYEATLTRPPYLAKLSNHRLQGDAPEAARA